ncbi:MAG: hypothetical protein HQL71_04435 [Magnetococcales bacterium]|nr:hypothetical protein [Magnetococcales bacterium]
MNNIFYISTLGHSASSWLAMALDMHPNITCYHGIRYSPDDPSCKEVDGGSFLEILQNKAKDNHFVGSVHGYPGTHIEKMIEKAGGQFATCIRNPIFRISSVYQHHYSKAMAVDKLKQRENFEEMIASFYANNKQTVAALKKHGLLRGASIDGSPGIEGLSYTDLCFMWSVMYVTYHDFYTAQSDNHVFRMEDYTQYPEAFADLFNRITKDQITLDTQYLSKVFNIGKINPHRKAVLTDIAEFKQWPENHQKIFKAMIPFIGPNVLQVFYKCLGYEFVSNIINQDI